MWACVANRKSFNIITVMKEFQKIICLIFLHISLRYSFLHQFHIWRVCEWLVSLIAHKSVCLFIIFPQFVTWEQQHKQEIAEADGQTCTVFVFPARSQEPVREEGHGWHIKHTSGADRRSPVADRHLGHQRSSLAHRSPVVSHLTWNRINNETGEVLHEMYNQTDFHI